MLKLMIVDDEPVIRNGLQFMVTSENTLFTNIVVASDGIEAMKLMEQFRPDLMITDIQMPEMDGLELIREAQRMHVKRFVVLSGYDYFEYAQKAIRLQVTDYLLKPIHQKELSLILGRVTLEIMEEKQREEGFARGDDNTDEDDQRSPGDNNMNIRKFKDFLQDHFMRDVSLEEVADHLMLHPNYVCNLLKRETGMTFVSYLRSIRIDKAKALLSKESDFSMEQIAKGVGYDNPRHFYKVFKQYVGVTPGSYRETAKRSECE
ncbi:DNA-binding response regulator [Paenibacillus sp. FSL A5-0031]|uniref:response regulator transcription factor n=1 Tax=Paenibacillus sp. FSL A5-0031 TaxID=1920420 RepID=UPI00096E8DD1|nr:response regulator [Paenibacillus sp. FSL A5-0031]OME85224.1 DNA-binding response regulator [Paenibacillus sp. FSL A5-0031]